MVLPLLPMAYTHSHTHIHTHTHTHTHAHMHTHTHAHKYRCLKRRWILNGGSNINTMTSQDAPSGPVVKNLPSNAGDKGSTPGLGTEIPHTTGQLSLCAITREKDLIPQERPPHAASKT